MEIFLNKLYIFFWTEINGINFKFGSKKFKQPTLILAGF